MGGRSKNSDPEAITYTLVTDVMTNNLRAQIERNLASRVRQPIEDNVLGRAAVVVAIVNHADKPCFLLTRRASKLRKHAGQYALPGGKIDPGETIEQAALRELHEELGIELSDQNILGLLDDYATRSGFCITPVIVWVGDDVIIKPNPDEVARVFHITLDELGRDDLVNLDPGETPDRPVLSVNLATVGHEVYAPTAAVIYQFQETAVRGQERSVVHYDQPRFAWR